MKKLILGLNTNHGDSSAALLDENGIVAAIAEERITRQKHTAVFPAEAIREVLRIAGASVSDLTDIAVARDPRANLLQKGAYIAQHPASGLQLARKRLGVHREVSSMRERIVEALGISEAELKADLHQVEHHFAHIASAYYWSPFDRCAAFSCDGAGDFATTMWAHCEGNDIQVLRRSYWPHSLGVFYTALTQFIGFEKYGEEYKVMGLSAYGRNSFGHLMKELVSWDPIFGLRLDLSYFIHHQASSGFEQLEDGEVKIPRLWGPKMAEAMGPARKPGDPLTDRDRDVAASMQIRYEEVFLQMIAALRKKTGHTDIVMAGGSALNSVANGRMITEGYMKRAYFQPAASDDGTALGAALHVLHGVHGVPKTGEVVHSFWGTGWSDGQIEEALKASGLEYQRLDREKLLDTTAEAIAGGKIVGWFQGREEWGPRALGNRSILCNPAYPDMKATLNARIKNREPFRPFAPVCREQDLSEVFEGEHPVPFMIIVYKVRPEWREKIPAITHEDGTGRVQTVRRDQNELYYDLITVFREKTGVPTLLNTSFNENEPIVHTPEQAIDCFGRTKMDCLGIGSFWVEKVSGTQS